MWKRQYISKIGRLTLILNTLSSMLIYFMSLFCMSRQVRLRLEKIKRDFLWGGGALVQKLHLVKWKTVFLEKMKGALGVRNLFLMNVALLCKWSWWYANEREALWKQVISQKYGEEDGGRRSREVRGSLVWGCGKLLRSGSI